MCKVNQARNISDVFVLFSATPWWAGRYRRYQTDSISSLMISSRSNGVNITTTIPRPVTTGQRFMGMTDDIDKHDLLAETPVSIRNRPCTRPRLTGPANIGEPSTEVEWISARARGCTTGCYRNRLANFPGFSLPAAGQIKFGLCEAARCVAFQSAIQNKLFFAQCGQSAGVPWAITACCRRSSRPSRLSAAFSAWAGDRRTNFGTQITRIVEQGPL